MMKGREKNGENELDLLWLHMLYEGFDDAKRWKPFNIDPRLDQEIKRND